MKAQLGMEIRGFTSLRRPDNLPDEIAHQIRQRILDGTLAHGQQLPTENELATAFDVSRNVVREAIARLKLAGYVETRRGTGTFVAQGIGQRNFEIVTDELLHEDALEHVFQLRVEIESGAAALAARFRTPAQLEALRLALAKVDEAGADWEKGADTALDFHLAVGNATNNPYFIRLMAHLSHVLHDSVRTLRSTSTGTTRIAEVEQEHHAIFDAIAAGNADQARAAMRYHLTNGIERHKARAPGKTT
ncbi:Transcriptional regulator, GntR-family [Cupriavidus necator]|uniref:FadR family transcriptional regulator n=1 Tax=Cupriavidus necator (strain ATCC 17699 / DSM 428 / KCTC 22496 / NCIMB 10442 / H16 / Stanier 337) TaxID=381666 RepID=Q0JYB3_CUPNH|nr:MULTISPECIES: FadR/GntR family transcriptional regulator [Cupriavidus]EON20064.1 GntR family transcriptional regulator [Cupriavidus sp. GA3-3]KUE88501.1 GntR family transcriptional regulator [Cupriavidus necator]QCC05026.1 FadR family transcriptional regulator [Cupriavidus necator H16]QQB79714.1 FadR family transcriptional regulator [Cupriavidus necator]WKA43959.1 FadR/GntR family transcriptional regulator [Cupriavidus necator]